MRLEKQIDLAAEHIKEIFLKTVEKFFEKPDSKYVVRVECPLCKEFLDKDCEGCLFKEMSRKFRFPVKNMYDCHFWWKLIITDEKDTVKLRPKGAIVKGGEGICHLLSAYRWIKLYFKGLMGLQK